MMKHVPYTSLFLFLIAPILLSIGSGGCGHTNNLAEHDVSGKKALYRFHSTSSGSTMAIVESPDDENVVADIAAIVGSGIVSDQAKEKLQRAVKSDDVAESVSQGILQTTQDYLDMKPVAGLDEDPDYIVETKLEDFKLLSGSGGVKAKVKATSRIVSRKTGSLVWEDCESHSVTLSNTFLAAIGPDIVQTGASVYNATQLLSLDEAEIAMVINKAAEVAGKEIGETLREDIEDMHKK